MAVPLERQCEAPNFAAIAAGPRRANAEAACPVRGYRNAPPPGQFGLVNKITRKT
jgi:hypothetical protein